MANFFCLAQRSQLTIDTINPTRPVHCLAKPSEFLGVQLGSFADSSYLLHRPAGTPSELAEFVPHASNFRATFPDGGHQAPESSHQNILMGYNDWLKKSDICD